MEVNWEQTRKQNFEYDLEYDDETEENWELLRKPVIPEPSVEDVIYADPVGSRLAEEFVNSGLQVIVKMASIELTPEKPEFPVGGWHVGSQWLPQKCPLY